MGCLRSIIVEIGESYCMPSFHKTPFVEYRLLDLVVAVVAIPLVMPIDLWNRPAEAHDPLDG